MIIFKKEEKEVVEKQFTNEPASILLPGKYIVTIKTIKFNQTPGKTPFLLVVFERESTKEVIFEKFYLTEKALDRLQHLHEIAFKKSLEANFENFEQVGDYFIEAFKHDTIKIGIVVGGEIVEGKLYSKLPFKYFAFNIVGFQEEVFSEGTPKYDALVKVVSREPKIETTVKPVEQTTLNEEIALPVSIGDELPF